jgi:xylulokinase
MHGAVFLDENLQVIRPAILWNDQRTAAECAEIDATVGPERVRAITGNPPLTGFQLPKILWLRKHEPEAFARLRYVLLPKDFIRLKLTGVMATDVSDASGTGAFDLERRNWSEELLGKVGLDVALFPRAFESYEVTGTTKGTSLPDGIPVVAGGGDQAAGAVGTGAVVPGVVSISLGTSGVVFTSLERLAIDPAGAVHTFCHANGGWHAMGVMLSCGGALAWYRDVVTPDLTFDQLGELAQEAELGAKGAIFLPYLAGERTPHNDPLARGVFAGLTLGHGRAELSRAVFEGVSFGLRDGYEILKKLTLGLEGAEVRVTSGGSKSVFWMQMLSDVLETSCVSLEIDEGPALGAALLAGVGIGAFPDVTAAADKAVRISRRFEPSGACYEAVYQKFRTAYPMSKLGA